MWKGKIVLVPFPFDDFSSVKVRPALCLTEPIGAHLHILIAFISSQIPSDPLPSDLVLAKDAPDFASTGLKVSSVLRLHRIANIGVDFITQELGELQRQRMVTVAEKLIGLFQLRRYL